MNSLTPKFRNLLRLPNFSTAACLQRSSKVFFSTEPFDSGNTPDKEGPDAPEIEDDDFLTEKPELQLQGVDPRKGWNFRGVHRAIICGKVGQAPIQKILRNGRTVTTFTVGTGGMFDQRTIGSNDLPKPAQWHRIAVHNPMLAAYAVQQVAKNSSVYVEGDIEIRVYNDSINGDIKSIPEICVRRDDRPSLQFPHDSQTMKDDNSVIPSKAISLPLLTAMGCGSTDSKEGRVRLIKAGESMSGISLDELREGLF